MLALLKKFDVKTLEGVKKAATEDSPSRLTHVYMIPNAPNNNNNKSEL